MSEQPFRLMREFTPESISGINDVIDQTEAADPEVHALILPDDYAMTAVHRNAVAELMDATPHAEQEINEALTNDDNHALEVPLGNVKLFRLRRGYNEDRLVGNLARHEEIAAETVDKLCVFVDHRDIIPRGLRNLFNRYSIVPHEPRVPLTIGWTVDTPDHSIKLDRRRKLNEKLHAQVPFVVIERVTPDDPVQVCGSLSQVPRRRNWHA